MTGSRTRVWFLREGLFAKYVISLVGLVVFVLAVNGAMETWISYRATKTSLTDAHVARRPRRPRKRIEQSMSDLERQISWVTRASLRHARAAPRRLRPAAATRCRRSASSPSSTAQGRELLRLSRQTRHDRQQRGFLPRPALHRDASRAASASRRPISATSSPFMSISVAHSGFNAGVTVAEIDLRFLSDFLGDAQVGKVAVRLCRRSAAARCWRAPSKGPDVGKDLSTLPQVAAVIAPGGERADVRHRLRRPCGADRLERGAEARLASCSSSSRPRRRWRRSATSWCGSRF